MRNLIILSICLLLTTFFLCSCDGKKTETQADNSLDWVNDSLNIDGLRKSGRWIDTTKTNLAFALYRGDTCILRYVMIQNKGVADIYVNVIESDNGTIEIRPVDTLDFNGEYFILNEGRLGIFNKENIKYSEAQRLKFDM
ncbi:MAG: hypothetical protein E6767_18835 [Dysgonomonas sp.]|nr:hypothetical protein [Dysgonomonas sp.]